MVSQFVQCISSPGEGVLDGVVEVVVARFFDATFVAVLDFRRLDTCLLGAGAL